METNNYVRKIKDQNITYLNKTELLLSLSEKGTKYKSKKRSSSDTILATKLEEWKTTNFGINKRWEKNKQQVRHDYNSSQKSKKQTPCALKLLKALGRPNIKSALIQSSFYIYIYIFAILCSLRMLEIPLTKSQRDLHSLLSDIQKTQIINKVSHEIKHFPGFICSPGHLMLLKFFHLHSQNFNKLKHINHRR